ncbi:MAG: hypothetical protein ACYDAQ_03340, partial [Mycobacteriales bacterium]
MLNALVAVLVLVLVAAVALVVKPPAPPGIAEFAPQASKPITKAPPQQAAAFGQHTGCTVGAPCSGGGGGSTRRTSTPRPVAVPSAQPSSGAAVTGVPSALQCFTWPNGAVTQTFDPQSPPCIASWPGQAAGNGGATTAGVTATTIRVGVPGLSGRPEYGQSRLVDFLNSHYEFYGRKIQLVNIPIPANYPGDATTQRAIASDAAALDLFAAVELPGTTYPSAGSGQTSTEGPDDESPYRAFLAAHHIITTQAATWSGGTAADLANMSPYAWDFDPPLDTVEANFGQVACNSLVNQPAQWAGPQLKGTTRKFAVLYQEPTSGITPPTVPLTDAISGGGGGTVQVTQ